MINCCVSGVPPATVYKGVEEGAGQGGWRAQGGSPTPTGSRTPLFPIRTRRGGRPPSLSLPLRGFLFQLGLGGGVLLPVGVGLLLRLSLLAGAPFPLGSFIYGGRGTSKHTS